MVCRPSPSSIPTERLTAIERELGTQGREEKKTRQAYGLFAVMAVLIAIVNLVVLSVKLDKKATQSAGTSQSEAAAEPAPPAPLGHTSATTLKEYTVTPRPSEVAAGRVAFKVRNAGAIDHEFVVLRTNKKASELLKATRPTRPATWERSATSSPARRRRSRST